MTQARLLLAVTAALFLIIGATGVLAPGEVARMIEVPETTTVTRVELRSAFGLYIGLSAFLLLSLRSSTAARQGLLALCLVSAGLLAGRLYGGALEGLTGTVTLASTLFEALCLGLGLWALRKLSTQDRTTSAPDALHQGARP
jgi:hypothetical protein